MPSSAKMHLRGKARVVLGDMREVLAGKREGTADAIVTDPPYGLSNAQKASPARIFTEIMFPQNAKIITESSGSDMLPMLIDEVTCLRSGGSHPQPSSTVPVSTMAFDEDISGGECEIEDVQKGSVRSAEDGAGDDRDTERMKYLGHFTLEFRNEGRVLQALSHVGCSFTSSGIRVGARIGTSRFPSLTDCCASIIDSNEAVRASHDTLADFVGTLGGAANVSVADFPSLGSGAPESFTTDRALILCTVLHLAGAKLVRTKSATRRLPSPLQTIRVSIVDAPTDWTLALDLVIHPVSLPDAGFMGQGWDKGVPGVEFWEACLRVLKPGGHLLAFGGTRTHHRLWCAIEDAGFEVRDCLLWLYGQGFPKSLNVSKAIDKAAGAEREVVGANPNYRPNKTAHRDAIMRPLSPGEAEVCSLPATDAARQWDGWGTALKPGWESILLARKPLSEEGHRATIVANLTKLEAQLWSLLPASIAEERFGSSQSEYDEACDFAQWSADERDNTRAALCAQMDTSLFESAITTCLSTVMSWGRALVDALIGTSTSTTETAGEPTIDWKTLSSCVSALTPRTIIEAEMREPGWGLLALPAARYLNAVARRQNAIHELSAAEFAISSEQAKCPVGTGQGFSPAHEPILLARKPLEGSTVAANVLEHGTGGLNVDGCRVEVSEADRKAVVGSTHGPLPDHGWGFKRNFEPVNYHAKGRWPANVVLDEEAAAQLDEQSGERASGKMWPTQTNAHRSVYGQNRDGGYETMETYGDRGGASRFFYCSKASKMERNHGLDSTRTVKYDLPKGVASCQGVSTVLVELLRRATSESTLTWLTGESGANIVGLCPLDSLSTTLTAIGKITESRILNLLTPSLINESIAAANCGMGSGGSPVESVGNSSASTQTTMSVSQAALARGVKSVVSEMLSQISDGENWKPLTNFHSTVKPLALMRWLVRMVTPPGGVVLDPFCGSGSTLVAAVQEGMRPVGIDIDEEYCQVAWKRVQDAIKEHDKSSAT